MRSVAWQADNGQTIVFDQGGPYYYASLTSTLGATAEVSRAPRQDGQTTYHSSLDAPSINLTGAMWIKGGKTNPALAEYDRQRALLCQAFAPNRWGTLIYYREDGPVQIRCRPIATPTISGQIGTYAAIDIDFVADSPYWQSANEYIVSLGVNLKLFRFPWAPVRGAMGAYNRFARVDNPTTEQVYPTLEVYTTGQYVTLTNLTTGKAVKIEHAIASDQKLLVDLADITAYLWTREADGEYAQREDVSHWMSLDSEPWSLEPGGNQVAIYNDVPEDTPRAFVRYRLPSLGV